jgi:hypothetical protein
MTLKLLFKRFIIELISLLLKPLKSFVNLNSTSNESVFRICHSKRSEELLIIGSHWSPSVQYIHKSCLEFE